VAVPVRDLVAATLTGAGGAIFLLGAGLGLAGQEGWFVADLIISLVLLIAAPVIGCYVPKHDRSEDD
jgi:multisubunit Na+/H+ antiporter MnhG subunit